MLDSRIAQSRGDSPRSRETCRESIVTIAAISPIVSLVMISGGHPDIGTVEWW
jgi:hypothetical protein